MRKFKCVVTRYDEYEIEFDENVLNGEWMEEFKKHFFDYDSLEEHAEHIAQHRARFQQKFIEGYGVPLIKGKVSYSTDESDVERAINIKIISEDDECEVEVIEL